MEAHLLEIIYLIASILYVFGLKMLSSPESARKGNLIAAAGMTLAIFATIFMHKTTDAEGNVHYIGNYVWIFLAMGIGTAIGWISAKKVQMTAMPQMVSIFNGMGGACAALIGLIEFPHYIHHSEGATLTLATIFGGLIIGSISFSGSMIAYAKLNGNMKKDIRMPHYNAINNSVLAVILILAVAILMGVFPDPSLYIYLLFFAAMFYGVLFVIPIGGADMPVVISLLNSFTGLAAAFAGFLYGNMAMLTGGILVGSAGTILTVVMCNAMNRSLFNVVFGAFGSGGASVAGGGGSGDKSVKEITVTDLAVLMNYSKKVIIVPGYGLAVAQAQHIIHEIETLLESKDVEVKYAIHPVAGRMPGHMNVLLAESNVDYSKLVEMEEINAEFATTDVVLVVGANDVVNPAAKNNPASPIYGMPILDVENSKHIVINKRSMNAGYAGIDNELFYDPKTSMWFGDAKKVLTELAAELKAM